MKTLHFQPKWTQQSGTRRKQICGEFVPIFLYVFRNIERSILLYRNNFVFRTKYCWEIFWKKSAFCGFNLSSIRTLERIMKYLLTYLVSTHPSIHLKQLKTIGFNESFFSRLLRGIYSEAWLNFEIRNVPSVRTLG